MYVTLPKEQSPLAFCAGLPAMHKKHARQPEINFAAGTCLFFEGDTVERLYQVKSGILRLTRLLEDGRRQVISFGYPGDIVGFPVDGLYNTDCDVILNARLQCYDRSALDSGKHDEELHSALLQAALREIGAMQDHFLMLGRKLAAERVASFLCVLSERVGVDDGPHRKISLPMGRSDIADFLGLTTETVSRSLSQLRRNQVIAIENIHAVTILRPRELVALSEGQPALAACPKDSLHWQRDRRRPARGADPVIHPTA